VAKTKTNLFSSLLKKERLQDCTHISIALILKRTKKNEKEKESDGSSSSLIKFLLQISLTETITNESR
jgi:hypothetical protein